MPISDSEEAWAVIRSMQVESVSEHSWLFPRQALVKENVFDFIYAVNIKAVEHVGLLGRV